MVPILAALVGVEVTDRLTRFAFAARLLLFQWITSKSPGEPRDCVGHTKQKCGIIPDLLYEMSCASTNSAS
jgi:hypothetical protein